MFASPDAEVLRSLYVEEKKSIREIGCLYGVSRGPITRWLRQASIPIRPRGCNGGGLKNDAHRIAFLSSNKGENHWNWKGGISSDAARYRASAEWARIRMSVYERDGWLCRDCGCRCLNTRDSKKYPKRKIQCHHIRPRRLGGPDTPDNLVTLCMSCHQKRERQLDAVRS